MALPKIGETISQEQFNKIPLQTRDLQKTSSLPKIGETITAEQFSQISEKQPTTFREKIIKTGEFAEKKFLKPAFETLIAPLGRAAIRPAVEFKRGIEALVPGGRTGLEPVKTPFGEITPIAAEKKALTPIIEAFDIGSTVIPVGKIVKPIIAPLISGIKLATKAIKSKVPKIENIASFLTGEKAKTFQIAKQQPTLFRKFSEFAEDENIVPVFGEDIFNKSKKLLKFASDKWKRKEANILRQSNPRLDVAQVDLIDSLDEVLSTEKISFSPDLKIDLSRSAFAASPVAATTFKRLTSIINADIEDLGDVLNKRVALTDIISSIPKEEANVKRVVNNAKDQFDKILNKITNNKADKLRADYAASVSPARKIINQMTDRDGNFSQDRARTFINQSLSDIKFDKSKLIGDLQKELKKTKISKEDITGRLEVFGAAKALSKLTPATQGRIKDVIFSFGIAKIPILAASVSPKFWGKVLSKSPSDIEVIKQSNKFKELLKEPLIQIVLQRFAIEELKDN